MLRIALRPRWIAALVLALAVAAGFALLSQWQLSRSVSTGTVVERPTETVLPLAEVAQPQEPIRTDADGQLVTANGEYIAGDTIVLSDRINGGQAGFWVVAHLRTADGAGLAVALGWSADRNGAASVASSFEGGEATVTGRFVVDEAPQASDFEHGELSTLAAAALVNLWPDADPAGIYNGYVVAGEPAGGLAKIDSPRPVTTVELNWLNVFYAAEWVIFAGFAVFLWWRLVRDVWEKERRAAAPDTNP
ncbi:MAG TPA: SURF1 family cytochrome oxidase biogenesis protein [Terrimesophilobacter sp.]|nr:SURF1 family cytochrome oxidase biogenesis protein [Terrimesophilobacter sp.]